MASKSVLLLDSSALLNAGFSFKEGTEHLITSNCVSELKSMESRLLADNALAQGLLVIFDPCPHSVQSMLNFLEKLGDKRLSKADVSVLALASELKAKGREVEVVTDDYSIQNALKALKIQFRPILQKGIKKAKKW